MTDNRSRNRALVEFLLLPTVFLTVALLGGLRVGAGTGSFVFVVPPLVTLVCALLLLSLAARGGLLRLDRWLSGDNRPLTNVAHALTLAALFFASAQAFNSVLPEAGLLRWMFSFFFLWTLWNNQFAQFEARRLLRSLSVLFGTAFLLKHLLLAGLHAPGGSFAGRLFGALVEGVTLGALDAPAYAPATGYISFFTLLLYVAGLSLLPPAPAADDDAAADSSAASALARAADGRALPPADSPAVEPAALEERRARLTGADD